ncbi:MAG: LamG domain-containing protein [Candidatus Sungbacteria bacterium]|nr:LamG domain-containing protein [Candidatus Sungbacteria bacterium]
MKRTSFVVCTLFLLLATALFGSFGVAYAGNTYSIDLESGSSQYLTAADSASLSVTGNLTLETWVKFESLPPEGRAMQFISKMTLTGNQRSWRFNLYNNTTTYQLKFEADSNCSNSATAGTVSWNPSIGVWYHVAVVYTASGGTADFYVNGVPQGSQQSGLDTSICNGTSLLYIGNINADYDDSAYLDGKMDDVRVWNVARTAAQIADNYNTELVGNESGLQGYWKLNNSLSDSTSNGNTLTNQNSAVFSTDVPFSVVVSLQTRKSSDESVTSSTTLQNDDELKLTLAANQTYTVDAVVFASSASSNPDLKIAFTVPSGATMTLGYIAASPNNLTTQGELLNSSGTASQVIPLRANAPVVIHVKGTVVVGSTAGDVTLQWAQFTSNSTATTVKAGSYIRADQLQ